ncbi:MAG: DUF3592 domain-containing protein [Atopobiaceae bacterium]|nr:DUF3592 domain-containing protein [Atopobiaceae bacterium]MBR3313421.1 DUF3592 domain-containing protein [Atopobiaceae bacterium]
MISPLLVIFVPIFSITFVVIAIPTLITINHKIKRCTQSVPGTFVRENAHRMAKSTYFMPVVSYSVNGVQYELEVEYAEGFGGVISQDPGTPCTVYYDPADPTYVWASREGTFGQRTGMKVLLYLGIAGLIFSGIAALVIFIS